MADDGASYMCVVVDDVVGYDDVVVYCGVGSYDDAV